ncbi:glycosyltransferase family 2 protein [Novosphingobium album (ex Liu et al. 2023)]|uniref:Glycosyltransferase family 2 protein n=1 Tax=Novosphingobium album (ex Liu et al. 2023) TaxID=3031130 RepID=A0ABT5WQU0_9SPHN|nr:glycosyltransferase family 2 protein [Novosphingobium album (ex Liu et al. 2023)]MDE8652412.1 glycosyltransferase family 2 protein [Novosphingobium album (ex Liu et al. 2023)]
MKITVVTAVYNRAATIAEAVASVQAQSYASVEHVIQDGGSSDGTVATIERLANASTRLRSEADHGIYDAINRGITRASGEVIGLMHSDDVFAHDHVLAKVASAFGDPSIDGVYGDLQYVAADDLTHVIRQWRSSSYDMARLRRGWMPPHPTLYLRCEVFQRWGLYDTEMRIAADYDAMLRYFVKGGITLAYIPEVLVKMRVGGESNRSLGHILRKSREDLVAIRRNGVGGIGTLAWKNFSKLSQFIMKEGTSA